MRYFNDHLNSEQLKKEYKRLARELHPDLNGGNDEAFKRMASEYEQLSNGKTQGSPQELSEALSKALMAVSSIEGLDIEIVGKWIWVSGETYPVKEVLKENGFKFSGKRKKWYFSEEKGKSRGSKARFEDLRKKYGAEKVKSTTSKKIN